MAARGCWIEALLEPRPIALGNTILQIGDSAVSAMSVRAFREALTVSGGAADPHRQVQRVFMATTLQSAPCNALHDLPQRCARWLLMAHDRLDGPQFGLSQEFMSVMLGVRRPTVTAAAGALQEAGIVRYRHGVITVLDRARLEAASCDCYRIVRDRFDRAGLTYPGPRSAPKR